MNSEAKSFTIVASVTIISITFLLCLLTYYVNTTDRDIQIEAIKAGLHQEVIPGSQRYTRWTK